jgi:hypothetical protein
MFITKKHLTRRTVLRGVGTALALPLLDAMIPANTALAQTAAKATPHLGFIYFPHGAVMNRWTPTGQGAIGEFGDILKPLDKYKSMTTVFSNIDNLAAVDLALLHSPGVQPGSARWNHRGPDRRATHRPGHAHAFARGSDGQSRRRRLLRPRLRLLLRIHDFIPYAHYTPAHGDQSAQAVHPFIRAGRQCG